MLYRLALLTTDNNLQRHVVSDKKLSCRRETAWWYHSKAWERFPIRFYAFYSNYGYILYHFRDKARYWSKIAIFSCPLHSTPPVGVPVGIAAIRWWKSLRICIAVSAEYRRMSDRRTDRYHATA